MSGSGAKVRESVVAGNKEAGRMLRLTSSLFSMDSIDLAILWATCFTSCPAKSYISLLSRIK